MVDIAKVLKDQALEEFDRNFIPIARTLEAPFRGAGETELADCIRPTLRQLDLHRDPLLVGAGWPRRRRRHR